MHTLLAAALFVVTLVPPASAAETRKVNSTAYCLTGAMKSGKRVYWGAAAVPKGQFRQLVGSRWRIMDGPLAGQVKTVEDQIGHGSQFDIGMPGACGAARKYGRRTITIRRV